MRMKKSYSLVLALLLCMGTLTFSTGCGKITAPQVINIIESQLPADLTLAENIAKLSGNPQLTAVFSQISTIAGTDLPLIQAAVAAYQSSKTAGNLTALAAAVNTLANALTPQVLAANRLVSTQGEAIAVAVVAGLSLAINGWAIALANSGAKVAQLPSQNDMRELAKLAGHEQVEQVAKTYGLTAEQLGL